MGEGSDNYMDLINSVIDEITDRCVLWIIEEANGVILKTPVLNQIKNAGSFHLTLQSTKGNKLTARISMVNLYLEALLINNRWCYFLGPSATEFVKVGGLSLSIAGDYNSLGGFIGILQFPKNALSFAVDKLQTISLPLNEDHLYALNILIVALCESVRFPSIKTAVALSFSETETAQYLRNSLPPYSPYMFRHWQTGSEAVVFNSTKDLGLDLGKYCQNYVNVGDMMLTRKEITVLKICTEEWEQILGRIIKEIEKFIKRDKDDDERKKRKKSRGSDKWDRMCIKGQATHGSLTWQINPTKAKAKDLKKFIARNRGFEPVGKEVSEGANLEEWRVFILFGLLRWRWHLDGQHEIKDSESGMKQVSVEVGAAVLLEGGLKSQKSQVTDFASSVSHMKVITASKRLKGGPNEVWSNIPSSTFQPRARPLFQYRHYSEQQPLKLNPTAICEVIAEVCSASSSQNKNQINTPSRLSNHGCQLDADMYMVDAKTAAPLTLYMLEGILRSQTVSSKTNAFDLILNLLDCETVLKASGHVNKFTDLMVKDEKTGACYRADHLLKDFSKDKIKKEQNLAEEKKELDHMMAVLDDLSADKLGWKIKEYGIVAPDTKNSLSDPYPFNLMFQTSIGLTGLSTRYMRPETAQGIFVNFKDLYYYNGQKLPFTASQIGQAFRNEISPLQGFFRVREFILAEIKHFVDPEDKSHPNSLTWRF